MNNITKELLPLILQDKDAWDRKTNLPNLRWIYKQLQMGKELVFYDRVYWLRFKRMMSLIKAWNIFPCEDWEQIIIGHNIELLSWSLTDTDTQELVLSRFEIYIEPIWNSDDWAYEEPTTEEIISLEIHAPFDQQMRLL